MNVSLLLFFQYSNQIRTWLKAIPLKIYLRPSKIFANHQKNSFEIFVNENTLTGNTTSAAATMGVCSMYHCSNGSHIVHLYTLKCLATYILLLRPKDSTLSEWIWSKWNEIDEITNTIIHTTNNNTNNNSNTESM